MRRSPSMPLICWSIRARTSASCPTSSARNGWRRCCKAFLRRSSTATISSAAARRCSRRSANTGGEGIISKKASATYSGTRTRNWLKIKCIQRQEFVIVGWSESDKRRGFRSLLLAAKKGGKLTYAGKVGTGFNAKLIEELMERMKPLATDKAPVEVPRAERKGAHWIEPKLVAEIDFAEFTDDGILRHPSFVGLREDKPAKDVVREVPKHLIETEKKPAEKREAQESRRDR